MNNSAGKSALVLLAPGAEEMEFSVITDVLRRAKVAVTVAGVQGSEPVTCSRQVRVVPDVALGELLAGGLLQAGGQGFDLVALPGGAPGARALAASEEVGTVLKRQWERGGLVAAICAAPIALLSHGIALGSRITHYPGASEDLAKHYTVTQERVCVAGKLITGIGPGASFEFALTLVEALLGKEAAEATRGPLLLP